MNGWKDFKPIRNFTLRPIQTADSAQLGKFELACSAIDGETNLSSPREWKTLVNNENLGSRSLIAINNQAEIAYMGWFEVDERVEEILVFLEGRVHPDYRGQGFGTELINWLEKTSKNRLDINGNNKPGTFRIMYYDRAPDAARLFENRGYTLMYIEQEMERDLFHPRSKIESDNLVFVSWSETIKNVFYSTYREAFKTRTDNLLSPESWHGHFANSNSKDFQPEFSLLVFESELPVAYAVVHIKESLENIAWISQIGVHQDYRRKGIGSDLIINIMEQLFEADIQAIKLSVNVNNPGAISLYKQMGFNIVKKLFMYHKPI